MLARDFNPLKLLSARSRTPLLLLVLLWSSGCQRTGQNTGHVSTPSTVDRQATLESTDALDDPHLQSTEQSNRQDATATISQASSPEAITAASNSKNQDLRATSLPERRPHDGYVGSASCLECHPDEHNSWSHSYHRTMTQVVSDESVAGGFDGPTREIYGWHYTAEKRGDQYWCRLDATDGSDASYEYPLVMSTGSHHMQKFWYPVGESRKLGMAPLVYLIEADKWMPESSAFLGPPDHRLRLREGAWNTGCIQCHATASHPRIHDADTMDPLVAELGIACEACHGPGEAHVSDKSAASIVNPRKLDATRSAQVCGQCHGAWLKTNKANKNWSKTGHDYRPGDDLFETRYYPHGVKDKPLHARLKAVESFWPDGENRVAGREMHGLLSSPCFANSQDDAKRMTCIACHDMHADNPTASWANDQMGEGMYGNAACLQCHEGYATNIEAHTHHAADSSGSQCYNCHMPFTSYGLLKAVRTHTIVSPNAEVSATQGKPNACNQCHLDQTLKWSADKLTEWYDQPTLELSDDDRKIAASVLWSLKGDAAQRALMAWSMGWPAAREASGEDWMVFYLVDLMFDDYDAIRYIAYRSLRQMDGFESIEFDHLRADQERPRVMAEVLEAWEGKVKSRPTDAKLLYNPAGEILHSTYQSLRQLRDNRPILLTE